MRFSCCTQDASYVTVKCTHCMYMDSFRFLYHTCLSRKLDQDWLQSSCASRYNPFKLYCSELWETLHFQQMNLKTALNCRKKKKTKKNILHERKNGSIFNHIAFVYCVSNKDTEHRRPEAEDHWCHCHHWWGYATANMATNRVPLLLQMSQHILTHTLGVAPIPITFTTRCHHAYN